VLDAVRRQQLYHGFGAGQGVVARVGHWSMRPRWLIRDIVYRLEVDKYGRLRNER
jgi:hypothetical protein